MDLALKDSSVLYFAGLREVVAIPFVPDDEAGRKRLDKRHLPCDVVLRNARTVWLTV